VVSATTAIAATQGTAAKTPEQAERRYSNSCEGELSQCDRSEQIHQISAVASFKTQD